MIAILMILGAFVGVLAQDEHIEEEEGGFIFNVTEGNWTNVNLMVAPPPAVTDGCSEILSCNYDEDCPEYFCIKIECPANDPNCTQPPCRYSRCLKHQCWALLTTTDQDKCKIGGCSSELCVGIDDSVVSPCVYKPEYECYNKYGTCHYHNGCCDWIASTSLFKCIILAKFNSAF